MNHCDKHNQDYDAPICPICLGERIIDFTHPESYKIMEDAKKELETKPNTHS